MKIRGDFLKCYVCKTQFNETEHTKCPFCGEGYFVIDMSSYQELVETLQYKQYEVEEICNQINELLKSSNKFKNTLEREQDIYIGFNAWLKNILDKFNISQKKNFWFETAKPYYKKPMECQLNPKKICNNCGDC